MSKKITVIIYEVQNYTAVQFSINSGDATWTFDPVSNKFKLIVNMNGQKVQASNVFVTINIEN